MPRFDPATWRLRIDGLVDRPQTLDYEQLRALPAAEQVSTFHCVTGWTVSNVHWRGVRFADLLAAAEPHPEAGVLTFTSAEKPYVDTLTLDQAHLPDVMLAYEMDGQPLPREHGAPVRVVIPDMYGYKGVKWVERITLGAGADPATGSSAATTPTPGWDARMASEAATSSGSRAPSGRCTGSTRPRSSGCSPPGSCSTCRGSASWSAGGRC